MTIFIKPLYVGYNTIRSATTGSKLLGCCLSKLSVDPIMWLPMTNQEQSQCIRWWLGWLPGGRLNPFMLEREVPRYTTKVIVYCVGNGVAFSCLLSNRTIMGKEILRRLPNPPTHQPDVHDIPTDTEDKGSSKKQIKKSGWGDPNQLNIQNMFQRAAEQPTATDQDESKRGNLLINLPSTIETEERVVSPPVEEVMLLGQLVENSNKENIDSTIATIGHSNLVLPCIITLKYLLLNTIGRRMSTAAIHTTSSSQQIYSQQHLPQPHPPQQQVSPSIQQQIVPINWY
ncbi:hypothetical protein INT45_008519 [Circinella minor]|uniref:Uncharacterized protein n=1 Tax=Circinella minor TaxID=1195481 RepID=A0A8H7SCZ9_9FUNG|nr:hypothetical protein INT45_008519 [Circinella minor]